MGKHDLDDIIRAQEYRKQYDAQISFRHPVCTDTKHGGQERGPAIVIARVRFGIPYDHHAEHIESTGKAALGGTSEVTPDGLHICSSPVI